MTLDQQRYVDFLEADLARFAAAVRQGPLGAHVAACPGWDVRQLTGHMGFVHRWSRLSVLTAENPQVVAFVQPGFELRLDHHEVESAFEVPLLHILDPLNHRSRTRELGAVTVQVYDIPYENYNIWGATAGMLTSLYKLLRTE